METNKTDLRSYGVDPAKKRAYENISYVLALVYNLLQAQVESYLGRYQLNAVQFNLLMLAAYQNNGKGVSQVQLAEHLIVSASNITKWVEKSVRAGLISRRTNPESRRENIICITAKGQKLIDKVWPGYDQLMRRLTEKIPVSSRPQLKRILGNWLAQLQQEK